MIVQKEDIRHYQGVIVWIHRNCPSCVIRLGETDETDESPSIFHNANVNTVYIDDQHVNIVSMLQWPPMQILNYILNVVLETLIYCWFIFGMYVEISQGIEIVNFFNTFSSQNSQNILTNLGLQDQNLSDISQCLTV